MKYYPEGTKLYILHSSITVNTPVPLLLKGGTVVATNKPEIVNHHFGIFNEEVHGPMGDHPYYEDLTWSQQDYERRDALEKEVR
jgi:hypothetical protein